MVTQLILAQGGDYALAQAPISARSQGGYFSLHEDRTLRYTPDIP